MVEFFVHCPKCGRRFHIKLENKKMMHLERETYQRTDSSRHYRLTGSTLTVLREGPPITLDVEDFEDRYKCGHCGHEWTTYSLEIHREQPASPKTIDGARRVRPLTALIIIGLVATASILGSAYVFQWFGGPLSCGSPTGNNPRAVRFTVVMTSFGYNDSYHHNPPPPYYDVTSPYIPQPWPTMNVTTGSNVFIQVLNNDTGQDHGFAIKHYFEQGVVLQPGQSCSLIFLASTSGTFPVYPPTLDRTYGDENAQLNVNP